MNEENKIIPLPTEVEKLISEIGQARYKLIVFMIEEYENYKHLSKRQIRRAISKEYNIDVNIIKTIQNQ